MLVIILWKHIQTYIFLQYITYTEKAKRDHVLVKNKGSGSLVLAEKKLDSWCWFILFQFCLHVENWHYRNFYVEGKCSYLTEKYIFQKSTNIQDGLILDSNLNCIWKSVKVLTASKNMIPSILWFEFSWEQLVRPELLEQQLVALII